MSSVYEGSGRWSTSSSVWATPFASPFPSLNRSLNRSSLRARAGVRPPMPAAVARARAASAGRPSASASPPPPPRSSPLPPAAHDAAGQAWDRGLRLPSVTRPPSSPVGTLNPSSSNPPSPARPPSLKRAVKLAVAKGPTWSLDVRRAPTAPSIRPPPLPPSHPTPPLQAQLSQPASAFDTPFSTCDTCGAYCDASISLNSSLQAPAALSRVSVPCISTPFHHVIRAAPSSCVPAPQATLGSQMGAAGRSGDAGPSSSAGGSRGVDVATLAALLGGGAEPGSGVSLTELSPRPALRHRPMSDDADRLLSQSLMSTLGSIYSSCTSASSGASSPRDESAPSAEGLRSALDSGSVRRLAEELCKDNPAASAMVGAMSSPELARRLAPQRARIMAALDTSSRLRA